MNIVYSDEELDPNDTCCTCYGCPDCEHTCTRTGEERAEVLAYYNDLSNFRQLTEEEMEEHRAKMKSATIVIPPGLAHFDYETKT